MKPFYVYGRATAEPYGIVYAETEYQARRQVADRELRGCPVESADRMIGELMAMEFKLMMKAFMLVVIVVSLVLLARVVLAISEGRLVVQW